MNRLTKAGRAIAEHLGLDGDSFEDGYRYQPSRWTKPVYVIGNNYWSAGASPPKNTQSRLNDFDDWERIVSSYDNKTVLWCSGDDD